MKNELKKTLSPIQLWAIIVGMVISGMYCGWNYALDFTSPIGFIIAILIVTIFYTTFMFSYAELSTAIPHAGGPSEYSSRAMGDFAGFVAGFACLIEFLFATPAIALAVGAYIHFIVPGIPVVVAALVCYGLFILINCLGVETAAKVELVVTIVAIIGLLLFAGAGITHMKLSNITGGDMFKGGFKGIFAAIPYAIWFYLAVEGGAMAAEECRNPKKDIPKGFILGIITLVILSLLTFFVTAANIDPLALSKTDSPLPKALEAIYGVGNVLSKIMSFIGLFGLIASLHGIIIAYSRQAFAMSRAGYFPAGLAKLNKQGTPVNAIILPSLIGMIFILTGKTATIIVISTFGAVVLYIISMVSLFMLRKKQPELERPYKVYYPLVPTVALVTAIILLVAITISNSATIIWVIGAFAIAICYYFIYTKLKANLFRKNEIGAENFEEVG